MIWFLLKVMIWNHGELLFRQCKDKDNQNLILSGEGSQACRCAKVPYLKTFHGNQFWEFAKALGEDKEEECSEKMIDLS